MDARIPCCFPRGAGGSPWMDDSLRQHGALHRARHFALDAEECISDVYLRVWDDFRRSTAPEAALPRGYRSGSGCRPAARRPTAGRDGTGESASPEDELLRRERTRQLKRAVDALGAAEQVFCRKYYYLQSTAQIAAEMGLSGGHHGRCTVCAAACKGDGR